MSPSSLDRAPSAGDWFGQPRGLTILFLTEMWEKFSFFGMRALLVLYVTKDLMFTQVTASWVYGVYAGGVYATPILGGIIADRWLGRHKAVLIGGAIMALGHFMMAFESLFFVALTTIALGNGLYLPSLPSQIDGLYERDDPRRKSAYNVYYVGINLGAFAAPVVVGTIGELCGFHWGFTVAGIGMIVGLVTYIAGSRYLPPDQPRSALVRSATPPVERPMQRFLLLAAIAAAIVIFRGAYEQLGNTIPLWTDTSVNRVVAGSWTIPVTWFQSLNPLMVFLLTPLLVAYWTRRAKHMREPSSLAKMAMGASVVAIAYLMVAIVAHWAEIRTLQASWLWLTGFLIVMTAGELLILPVGLGLFGRLAPEGLRATTIALWFSAGFLGNLFAGWLGTLWSPLSHGAFFLIAAGVVALAMTLLLLLLPWGRSAERAA